MKAPNRYRAGLLCLVLVFGSACVTAHSATDGSFERTLNVSGPVDLDISTGSGNVTVRSVKAPSVRVRGFIHAHAGFKSRADEKVRYLEAHPPIEQTGNVIRIGRIENREYAQNVSISYELDVPADIRVKAHSGSGNVSAVGVDGSVELTSGSGNVTASGIGGELRARTGSGSLEIDSTRSAAQISTGSGSIRALGIGGALKAKTGSGNIKTEQVAAGDLDAESGSGSIEAAGVRGALRVQTGSGRIDVGGEPAGSWNLHAGSGSVDIRLRPGAAFDFYGHTSSGKITLDHPITVTGTISPKELRGKVRGGGPLVEAASGSGDVHVR